MVAGVALIRQYGSSKSKNDSPDMSAKQLAKLDVTAAFDKQR